MKLKKLIYNLFFKKKKRKYTGKSKSRSNSSTTKPKRSEVGNSKKYDLSSLKQQVSETEYISNLRLGRSWILPQMVKMGFKENRNGKKEFDLKYYRDNLLAKYNDSPKGRREIWQLLKRNYIVIETSKGRSSRSRWWTKDLLKKMVEWDFNLSGKARKGLKRKECIDLIENLRINDVLSPSYIINKYDKCRMRKRKALRSNTLPDFFIDAFEGDGAYNAMITMVKLMDIRIKGKNDCLLRRDRCIKEIEKKSKQLNGHELLKYCKKTFFDSGAFDSILYLNRN